MKYREKILEIISNNNFHNSQDALSEWLETIPLLEQTDILREIEGMLKEIADEKGINLEGIINLEDFNSLVDEIEEAVLE